MNNREKAKAVQKKFNQRLGIYYGVMAAGLSSRRIQQG
jgi:hypothetical protein